MVDAIGTPDLQVSGELTEPRFGPAPIVSHMLGDMHDRRMAWNRRVGEDMTSEFPADAHLAFHTSALFIIINIEGSDIVVVRLVRLRITRPIAIIVTPIVLGFGLHI